jgi:hypothetical protein
MLKVNEIGRNNQKGRSAPVRSFQRIHWSKIKGKLGSKNDKEDKEDAFDMHIHIMFGLPKSPPTMEDSINLQVFKPNPL